MFISGIKNDIHKTMKERRYFIMYQRELFDFYFDQMNELVFLVEVAGEHLIYKDVNKTVKELFGPEIIDQSLQSVLPPHVYAYLYQYYMEAISTKKPLTYTDINVFSMNEASFETILTPLLDDKKHVSYVLAVTKDISERKEKEEDYLVMEAFMENAVDAILIVDQHARILRVSQSFEEMFGWKQGEVINNDWFSILIIPPHLEEESERIIREMKKGEAGTIVDTTRLTKEGKEIPVSISYSPIMNKQQEAVAYSLIYRDITHVKELEFALEESKERYKSLFANHQSAVFMVDLNGIIRKANKACERIFRESLEDIMNQPYMNLLRRENGCGQLNKCMLQDEKISHELSFTHKNGEVVYLYVTNVPVTIKGEVIGAYLIVQDVTKEKKAEQSLKRTLKDLENMKYALDESAIVTVTNEAGQITYINEMFSAVSQYIKEELIGQTHEILNPQHDESLLETIQSGRVWKGEIQNQAKDGSLYWVYTTIVPLSNINGEITEYIAIHTDITERKMLEHQLFFEAFHDHLTGLPNRASLEKNLKEAIRKAKRLNKLVAVMFLDCDHFKEINDMHGHDIGDQFLVKYTNEIKQQIRNSDSVYRLGGDEFIIVLENVQHQEEVESISKRIHHKLQGHWYVGDIRLFTTTTIGIAVYPDHGTTPDQLIRNADAALYKGKRNGKNSYTIYDVQKHTDASSE
ncbi:PAS domain S-box protein [Priestia megaterium]|nr:PAS domain S-box protein [Priestia megaterium]